MSSLLSRPTAKALLQVPKVLALVTALALGAAGTIDAQAAVASSNTAHHNANVAPAAGVATASSSLRKVQPKPSLAYPYGTSSKMTVSASTPKKRTISLAKGTTSLQVQRYDTAKRKWIASSYLKPTRTTSTSTQFTLPMLKFTDGSTHKFRLHVPEQQAVSSWTGKTQTVSWPKSKTKIGAGFFEDLTVISSASGLKAPVFVGGKVGRSVQLQQKVNNRWQTKASGKTNKKGITKLRLPKLKHNTKASFRIHAPATSSNAAATGKTVTVKYSDPRKTKGLAKEVYDLMKNKCPNTAVTLAPKAKYKGWAASAFPQENRVIVYEKMNRNRSDWKNFISYIATHECGHVLISNAADKSNVTDIRDRLNKLLKTSGNQGVERMADAVSAQWRGKTNNNYYTKNFTRAQKNAAKKILAGRWY